MKLLYKRITIMLVALIIVGFTLMIIFVTVNYNKEKDKYFDNQFEELNIQLQSTLTSHEHFSNYVYDTLINDEYVLTLFDEAYEASESRQEEIRNELYDYFENSYLQLSEYDFRQLHFHFPDSTSFLRMHSPLKYGDSLIGIRYSVEYVNTEREYISGFEEGRIFNGYRFVSPLSNNGEHIGSVEVSISISAVINSLTEIYESDYVFLMSKEVIDENLFADQLENYQECSLSDDYLIDKEINLVSNRILLTNEEIYSLFVGLSDEVTELPLNENFAKTVTFNNQTYEVIFHPIENIEEETVAYFISISEGSGYEDFTSQYFLNVGIIIFAYITIVFGILTMTKRQKLLYAISNTDKLTDIDNRHKLQSDFDREMKRMRRNSSDFSILMFDIDLFKNVNDKYGHNVGDEVLKELSKLIGLNIRGVDYFSRYGGEEFIILLIGSNLENSILKAESLRKLVEEHIFNTVNSITVSFGVYHIINPEQTLEESITCVDNALYESKHTGRNKVSYVSESSKVEN